MLESLLPQERKSSLKMPLLLSIAMTLLLLLPFLYWLDRTNADTAALAFAEARDYIGTGNYDKAMRQIDIAIKHKGNAEYYYEKYKILIGKNKYNEAEISLNEALRHDPGNSGYAFEAGHFYADTLANEEQGLHYFKKAVDLDRKNSDYKLAYGATLFQFGYIDEGINILEQLVRNDPNYYSVWNDLAAMYNYGGYAEKALATRLQAVKKFPDDAYHWFWLANTYDLQGNSSKAVEAYKKSISLDPDSGAHASYRIAALTGKKVAETYRQIVEDTIPVVYKDTHAYVRANIAGYNGLFLLDTGATDTILYKGFIDKNGIDIGIGNPTTQYETATGALVSAPIVYADSKIGRFDLENIRVAVIQSDSLESGMDGIIGMNVLKHFNMRMDNLRQTLLLSRK